MLIKKYLEFLMTNIEAIAEETEIDCFTEELISSVVMIAMVPIVIAIDIITFPLQLISYIMLKTKKKKN